MESLFLVMSSCLLRDSVFPQQPHLMTDNYVKLFYVHSVSIYYHINVFRA